MRKIYTILALIALTVPLQGCLGVKIVGTGQRGVKVVWGKAEPTVMAEGFYIYNPFSTTVVEMDTRTQVYKVDTVAYTKDVQQAKLSLIVNYNLNRDKAAEMYANVGNDWEDKLIPQTVQGTLKAVIGKWDAVELIANRSKAQQEIQDTVTNILATKDITVTRVEIQDIEYNKQFEKAVEAKVTAIQEAEQQKNITVSVQEQAKQTVITAQADAQAMKIKSDALSQNANLVNYEAVQKWDGKLPEYMMGNSVPFISISK